jgi:hypothetical protein|tara:strand:- start:1231 stop:1416 length:186 start_codon:yes stop_codon:yes gene_type:complete
MQFNRKTSSRFPGTIMSLSIKAIFILIFFSVVILILDKINLPAPNKNLKIQIPNEQLKVLK